LPQTVESLKPPKRFYSGVSVAALSEGFAIHLDGRTPRTPAGRPLVLPTGQLAKLVADEWSGQGDEIVFASMPATRLAHTAIDGVEGARDEIACMIVGTADADQICYFAEGPERLVKRQEATWLPLIAWMRTDLGLAFDRGAGVVPFNQAPETLAAVKALAMAMDDFHLAGFGLAAQSFGSVILAVALERGRLGGADAAAAAQLDEIFQASEWGEDEEAAGRRRSRLEEALMLQAWFKALGPGVHPNLVTPPAPD
jgi:chaperone required for assembly of F1-ATPase